MQDGEQLMHTGDQGNLLGLAACQEPLREGGREEHRRGQTRTAEKISAIARYRVEQGVSLCVAKRAVEARERGGASNIDALRALAARV
jgi:hypothetical protein